MKAYLVGALPRPETLIKTYRDFAKKRISSDVLQRELEKVSRMYIEVQEKAGLSYILDGMLAWNDLLRPFASSLENVEINGLSRWFDNNFFYKRPLVQGRIRVKDEIDRSIFFHHLVDETKRKIVLPEPYCFARLSENHYYKKLDEFVMDAVDALADFVEKVGPFSQIQMSSPSLVFEDVTLSELEISKEAVAVFRKKTKKELFLHLPFGSSAKYLEILRDFDVDVLGIDLYKTPVETLKGLEVDKALYVGVLDGRNTLLEDVSDVVSMLRKVERMTRMVDIHFGPNCELEHLPSEYALKKIVLLGDVLKQVG
ncbi:MAG: hypothetical protein NZ921_01245 [Candidatus Caldarchaeum sp.]|nr:hypothetical protein [Candidatus Caldarchaeum sp.]